MSQTLNTPETTEVEVSGKDYVVETVTELIATHTGSRLGAKTLAKKVVSQVFTAMFEAAVSDGYLRLPAGLGAFQVKQLKASVRRNPATGASLNVPARKKLVFKQGKELKARLVGM